MFLPKIEQWVKSSTKNICAVFLIAFTLLSTSNAQSVTPQKLADCTPETEKFIEQRQAEIQKELAALPFIPAAGYYECYSESGYGWYLMWSPKNGFIAYILPDVTCPAEVSYGTVKYHSNRLSLVPAIEFAPNLRFRVAKEFRIIRFHKRRFLVPVGKLRQFNRERRWKVRDGERSFMSQHSFEEPIWRVSGQRK